MSASVFQIKVTLRHIRPPIWRRLRVPADVKLPQLHAALQVAFGWTNSHLHQFRVGPKCFGMRDPDGWDPQTSDERKVRLVDIAGLKSRLVYEYDFGDGWEHDIVVERVDETDDDHVVLECLDGRRAGPPEDCGGPYGYADVVEALANPELAEHQERLDWLDPCWQPESFDLAFINKELRTLAARRQRASKPRLKKGRPALRSAND